jgi:hypothetical protein
MTEPPSEHREHAYRAVRTYPTRLDAETAQALLAAEGIQSVLAADDAGGAYPFDLSGGPSLIVDEADLEAAAQILDGHDGRRGAS